MMFVSNAYAVEITVATVNNADMINAKTCTEVGKGNEQNKLGCLGKNVLRQRTTQILLQMVVLRYNVRRLGGGVLMVGWHFE